MSTKCKKAVKIAAVLLIAAAAVFLILRFVDISAVPDDSSSKASYDKTKPYVTVTVEYSAVFEEKNFSKLNEAHKSGKKALGERGYFVKDAGVNISEGDTALDTLLGCCQNHGLSVEYQKPEENIYNTAYIEGIGGLYEGDCTKNSGWVYTVNGEQTELGMSEYEVSEGDEITVSFIVF